jgi:hypothetical protein
VFNPTRIVKPQKIRCYAKIQLASIRREAHHCSSSCSVLYCTGTVFLLVHTGLIAYFSLSILRAFLSMKHEEKAASRTLQAKGN